MKRLFSILSVSITALTVALFCIPAQAGKPDKPGGGGGPGQNGGGVIYFSYNQGVYTMNDDGSGVTEVTGFNDYYGAWGNPSYHLHAGKRWFLQGATTAMIIAVSDSGDLVQLPVQAGLEILGGTAWTKDDLLISFQGRVRDTDPNSPTFESVIEGGLYAMAYNTDGDGNVSGPAGPAVLLFGMNLVTDSEGELRPDMEYHDWGPDGSRFVFNRISIPSLEIGDVSTGTVTLIYFDPTDDSAYLPRWSPEGDKIAFHRYPDLGHLRIMLINADGSGLKMLVRGSPNWTRTLPVWSPTGSHLLYHHWDHFWDDSHVVRVTADGSGKTRITDRAMGDGFFPPRVMGWRQ